MKQRGAALLMAMLTVALVATFAAAALWQQWRSVEVETAERARIQSSWILTGALDWARLLLREDSFGRGATQVDHLGEPWAVPLQEARLSSFLAADKNNTATDFGPEMMEAFLSGQIIDEQSMMNLNNMIVGAKPDEHRIAAFARLFAILQLPESELTKLHENLRFAIAAGLVTPSPPQAPLQPKRLSELVWLGISPATISALEPYVTIIPRTDTALNVNTASPEAIAAVRGIDLADAQRMVQVRSTGTYFRSFEDFEAHLASQAPYVAAEDYPLDVKSNFFEVRARLRLDKLVVEERSVLERIGLDKVRVVSRERGTGDPTALSRLAVTQR
jgi:general secretion pathway protein K